jgi:hypothetical protein
LSRDGAAVAVLELTIRPAGRWLRRSGPAADHHHPLNGLVARDKTIGLETICVGGGQGMAMVIERLS